MSQQSMGLRTCCTRAKAGLLSLGVPGHPQILADQLTLSQPRGADYAHQIILAPPDFQTFRRPCNAFPGRIIIYISKKQNYTHNHYQNTQSETIQEIVSSFNAKI